MTCVITGADFVDSHTGRWLHGDLHDEGEVWVFVGCAQTDRTLSAWQYSGQPGSRQLIYRGLPRYFEFRAIIVASKRHCELSEAAEEYIRGT